MHSCLEGWKIRLCWEKNKKPNDETKS